MREGDRLKDLNNWVERSIDDRAQSQKIPSGTATMVAIKKPIKQFLDW